MKTYAEDSALRESKVSARHNGQVRFTCNNSTASTQVLVLLFDPGIQFQETNKNYAMLYKKCYYYYY